MPESIRAVLFAEDAAHGAFLKPMLSRVATEEKVPLRIDVVSAQGGHARAMGEFKIWHTTRTLRPSVVTEVDAVVVAIDGNCSSFAETRDRIRRATPGHLLDRLVAACPDPHIERWFMADPESFARVAGAVPDVGPEKCARDHYKRILVRAVESGGMSATPGSGREFARHLVSGMDLYRAGKNCRSLGAFIGDTRDLLRRMTPNTE